MSRKVAYIDAFSGVAGDMLLAALVDAGLDPEVLKAQLKTLEAIEHEWDLSVTSVVRSEGRIGGKHVHVASIYNHEPAPAPGTMTLHDDSHSHSHAHGHGHTHGHAHGHSHHPADDNAGMLDHDHGHGHAHPADHTILSPPADSLDPIAASHEHTHDGHSHDGHEHHNRGLQHIRDIVRNSALPPDVQATAIAAFTELAVAESRVHGTTLENVHFHEVGAIDSIVDTVSRTCVVEDVGGRWARLEGAPPPRLVTPTFLLLPQLSPSPNLLLHSP